MVNFVIDKAVQREEMAETIHGVEKYFVEAGTYT